jgi:predicted small metal-binding protein
VTKSFRCRDAGLVCRAQVTGETEEEVLRQAIAHAREVHGVDLTDSRTLARHAQSLIRDDGRPAAAGAGT